MNTNNNKKASPSMDQWIKEAKASPEALEIGMYLFHNGVVRVTPKAQVRQGIDDGSTITGMEFSFDQSKVDEVVAEIYKREGIFYVRVWMNEGHLEPGDDIMYALVGGDIRPNVIDALQFLVGNLKNHCVTEKEIK